MSECDDPRLAQFEMAPHLVDYEYVDGEFENSGHTELCDGIWEKTNDWLCRNCGERFDSKEAALEHAQ